MLGRPRGLRVGVEELKDVGATRARAGEGGCSPSITPVSPVGGRGRGRAGSLGLSHLGWETGTGMGSAGTEDVEQGIKPSRCWRPSPCGLCCSLCLAFPKFLSSHLGFGWGGSRAGACTASPSQRSRERVSVPSNFRGSYTTACLKLKTGRGREVIQRKSHSQQTSPWSEG